MESNRMSTAESQAQPQKSSSHKAKPRRRLDHMRDLADGVDRFDMVPRRLSRLYIDGKFPESKYRLLLCMMSHSDGYHVRRDYLQERFATSTLVKYLKELIEEGYIEAEAVPIGTGGYMKLYHVRSLEHWGIYRHPVDRSVNAGPLNAGPLNAGLRDTKDPSDSKKSKNKNTNDDDEIPRDEPIPALPEIRQKDASSSSVRDVAPLHKPEDLRPSDYVNLIAPKIKSAKVKDGKVTWVPQIQLANKAAADFLKAHGHEMMRRVCQFILDNGRISVGEGMFFSVLPYIEQDSGVDLSMSSR